VAKGSSEEAYNQILRFSKLLRFMMSRSERIDISLREEFDFIKNYLELEKFRFKDDFEYAIEISEDVDANIRIPRMLVQLLVENSIKHGLRNKIGLKSILIKVYSEEGKTKITVEDNGVGRQKAQEKTSTTGMGLKIINDIISLNKKLTGKEITLNYIDLDDENGVAQGTSVEVII
jgi:LytS/YehU family sensor histidine kinase